MQRLLALTIFIAIFNSVFSQTCTMSVNYTFVGACKTIAPPFNNSRYYSLVQSQIVSVIDQQSAQNYQYLVGNRSLFLPGTPCQTTYYNYVCSSLQPCYGGRIAKPCFQVCVDFYYQCSFFTYFQSVDRCLNISGAGNEFAAQGDTFCESVWSGSRNNHLSFGLLLFLIIFVINNILNKN